MALRGKKFCYFHDRSYKKRKPAPRVPPVEVLPAMPRLADSRSIRHTRIQIQNAIAANRIDHEKGKMLLFGLQIATSNLKNLHPK